MRILLTGATGYLGNAVLRALLDRGDTVIALVRDPQRLFVTGPTDRLRVVRGDLLDPHSYRTYLDAVDAVIHIAALVKVWVRDLTLFERVNVEATERIIRLAQEHGVAKILYTSSFIALGPSPSDHPLDESATPRPPFYNAYHRTKALALQRVRMLKAEGAPVIVLFPGVIYGPGVRTAGNFVAGMLHDFLTGRLPGYIGHGHQRWCFAWIDDVVRGFLQALDRAEPGAEYILGGENRSLRELFQEAAAVAQRRPPRFSIPGPIVQAIAGMQFVWDRLRGREPRAKPDAVRILLHDWMFSSDRAQRELGYTITPFTTGIRATVHWLIGETGTVSPSDVRLQD